MALLTQKNVGGNTVSSSSASLTEKGLRVDTVAWGGTSYTTPTLATPGLPNVIFWMVVIQGTPLNGSWMVEFQAATRTEQGQPFFEFIRKVLVPPEGIPYSFSFEYPSIAIRAIITAPDAMTGDPFNQINYTLSAYGP